MKFTILTISFIFSFYIGAIAQQTQKIDLSQAINIALENNYTLKQARNNLDMAEYQVRSEKADFLPSFSTSISGSKRIGRQFNNTTVQFGNFTINGMSGRLNADLDLFSGFQNINSLKSSQYSAQASQSNAKRIRETVIFNTASDYMNLLLNKELLKIDQQNLESSQAQLQKIQEQVKVGSLPKADLYSQQSTVANNKLAVTNSENTVKMSKIRLIRQLQLDDYRNVNFFTPEIKLDSVSIQPKKFDLNTLTGAALQTRSDLKQQKMNAEASKFQLENSKGSLYPSASLSAGLSSNYNDQTRNRITDPQTGKMTLQKVDFSDQFFDQNINRSINLNISIPIFSNYNRRSNIKQSKINYKNSKLQIDDVKLQVIQEVQQAYNDYESVIQRLKATRQALLAAQKAYQTQQARYEVGSATFVELNQANANYVQARSNRVQAIYNYMFQKKLLDYYTGQLQPDINFKNLEAEIY